ncbi:hypothetical protein L6164_008051 [Bauhinia variegata]|uniref:Uncharacterized protein n=1 Tax=Bauhinia variegata TaxID=167791 RepID=A0ACB9PIC7_BAUVA|nr:hypothetical protein L6164_008051 [Bauhinia variegata]
MEVKKIMHYSSSQKILLVGEGDFSFSLCLAKAFGTAANMAATSLDSEDSILHNYSSGSTNLDELEELGCTIVHGVDAHTMSEHTFLKGNHFDRIIFNFPHAGFTLPEHHWFQIELHQDLVRGFLGNAREILGENGEIHVTHKTSYPFNKWEIEKLANEAGLCIVEKVPFYRWNYPGYINKRGHGPKCGRTFPVGESATFKFALDPVGEEKTCL